MAICQLKSNPEVEVDVELVKKDTTIKTAFGDALVTKGNYVITFEDGSKVGITKTDLNLQYKPVKK